MANDLSLKFYKQMFLIRRTEETLLALFTKGVISGTTHTCIGQEVCAVGAINALDLGKDIVVSNHRCHGHLLVATGDLDGLLGEVMGKATGICGGVGGSQHLHKNNFYTNGIQGGMVPMAAGIALAEKLKGTNSVTVCFIGDGTMGQGVVYETLNMVALWSLPLLIVLENNGYAQTTPLKLAHAGSLVDRPAAFGVRTTEISAESPEMVFQAAQSLIKSIREGNGPAFLALNTYRLSPHSKGDDFRPKHEMESYRRLDPLLRLRDSLPALLIEDIEGKVERELAEAVERATKAPVQSVDTFLNRVGVY